MHRLTRPSPCGGISLCCICFKGFRLESEGWDQNSRGTRDDGSFAFARRRRDEGVAKRSRFLPRVLTCRHNACDSCLRNAIASSLTIRCRTCNKASNVPHSIQELDKAFPVNVYVLGTLFSGMTDFYGEGDDQVSFFKKAAIKRESPIPKAQAPVQFCTECRGVGASFCDSCNAVFCHPCFTKVHSKANVLMGHRSTSLIQNSSPERMRHPLCSSHPQFKLEFFCILCNVSICTECLITEHNGHKLQSIAEKNKEYLDEVVAAYTSISNVQRSAKQSIKEAKKALTATEKGSDGTAFKNIIKDHFLQLHSHLVRMEAEFLARANTSTRVSSLNAAIDRLTAVNELINQALQKTKLHVQNEQVADFGGLVKELRELANFPCVLTTQEKNSDPNCLNIDDTIFHMLDEHVTLRLNDTCEYVIRSIDEVPAEATAEVNKLTLNEAISELKVWPSSRKPPAPSTRVNSDSSVEEAPLPHQIPLPFNRSKRRGSSFSDVSAGSSLESYAVETMSLLAPPETLTPGVSFAVEVTHMTNPSDFFVQRCGIIKKLEDLNRELGRYSIQFRKKNKKEFKELKEGDKGMTKYQRDGSWCRCEILSYKVGKSTYKVLFTDYGTTEKVDKSSVYPLPQVLIDIPPMAIRCGLARVRPASVEADVEAGKWHWEVCGEVFKMLRGRGRKSIVILHEDARQVAQVRLVVEHPVCPIDVALSLVYLGYAVLDGVVYPLLEDKSLEFNFRKFNEQPRLSSVELDDTVVQLVHVESPSEFYIRIPSTEFSELDLRLQVECKRKDKWMEGDPKNVFWPVAGMAVAVLSENKHWERATITEPLPDRMLKVFLVDVGRREIIEWDRAQVLEKFYFKFPPQAYKCSLLHVAPVGKEWPAGATDLLRSFQINSLKVRCTVWDPVAELTGIVLTTIGLSTDTSINALLVKEGFATNTGSGTGKLEYAKFPKIPSAADPVNGKSSSIPAQPDDDDLSKFKGAVLRGPDGRFRLRVTILKMVNPGEFYLKFDYVDDDYTDYYQAIEKFFKTQNVSSQQKLWKPYDRCIVKFNSAWKRAVVLEEPLIDEHQRTVVKVKFVDEIGEAIVPTNGVMDLPPFPQPGDRVVPCSLGGLIPAPGSTWTQSSIQEFEEFANQNRDLKLYIVKMKTFGGEETIAVELFRYHKLMVPLKDTPTDVWVSFNHLLRMKGMAKADENTLWDSRGRRKYTADIEGSDGCINVMEDEVEVLANLMKARFHWTPEGGLDITKPRLVGDFVKTKWFPPQDLPSLNFAGKVTFVGPDCEIYIQDYVSGGGTLQLINEEAAKVCAGTEPEDIDWEVGDICIATFWADKRWYRGEILETLNDRGCHLVKFVDYGNREYILPEDLRRPSRMTMRRVQARPCYFDNFAPITERWEKPQLDKIHEFLVDKICRIELRHLSSGFLGIVKMYLPEETDALQELVSRGFGRYLNPSKPSQVVSNAAAKQTDADTDSEAGWSSVSGGTSTSFEPSFESSGKSQEVKPIFWWSWYRNRPEMPRRGYQLLEIPETVDCVTVDIMAILGPDRFLVQVYESENAELNDQKLAFIDLQAALQSEAEFQECISPPYELKECCCLFGEDGVWYRAVVLQVKNRNPMSRDPVTVYVQYVDYGNIEEKCIEEVRQLKVEWFSIPTQTIPCRVAGYKFSGVVSHTEAKEILNGAFRDVQEITAVIKKREADCLAVEFRTETGRLIYQDLIDNGFFVPY